jgi:tetratricopeptide (TPR) repeat protein
MQRQLHVKVSEAITTIRDYQTDVAKLKNDMPLKDAFGLLEVSKKQFENAIEAYKKAAELIIKPLQVSVVEKSDTASWVNLTTLSRQAFELEFELREAAAYILLSNELEQACKQVEAAKEAVLEDKFNDLAEDVRAWWNRLRPDEPAFFSDLGLRKKAQRTIDFKAGLAPSRDQKNAKLRNAIAVFSQSQMHCLGLATFFARTCKGCRFIILDDPIITIDDDYSVHFFTAVLRELYKRKVQVIMLTYDQKTWRDIQSRYDNGRSEAFQLNLDNPAEGTVVLKSSDALTAMLKTCDPFTTSSILEHRKECCQKIRDCTERWCKELLLKKRREEGDDNAMLSDYTGHDGTLRHLIPLVTPYLDSDEPGKLNVIRDNTNPGNHDGDVPSKEALKVYLGDLKKMKKKYLG